MNTEDRKVKAFFLKKAQKFFLDEIRWKKENLDNAARTVKNAESIAQLLHKLRDECEFFNQEYERALIKHLATWF